MKSMSNNLIVKNPTTPSQRFQALLNRRGLKKKILKTQTLFFKNRAGRNHKGQLTCWTKGGGHKRRYRIVWALPAFSSAIVENLEYDPYRCANIARIFCLQTKKHYYTLAPEGLAAGHLIRGSLEINNKIFKIGNSFFLGEIPLGFFIYNIPFPGGKGGVARAAGTSAQLIAKSNGKCLIRLKSGKQMLVASQTIATIGRVSNPLANLTCLGKAGRSRWLNKRPRVRGVAMNPVDHPHGGGEGKTSGGRPSVTPWGKVAHGQPTRRRELRH